jgi:glycosyltransferase involved in cell wall biosynthesis
VDFPVSSNPFSRWKYNHPAVSRILCVSEEIKRITKPAIRNTSVLEVVHSGIDLERYARPVEQAFDLRRELGLDPNTPLVGNLSALADHKDYPTWIRTARRLSRLDPNMRFIIAGTGPDEQLIRDQILQAGLQDTVFLLGFRKDVERLMQSLDLFLITSKTEGLGTIVLEALAAGVPVVATRAGGIPEMIIDGETGLLAPIGDDNTLAQSVLRIFTDTALRETLVAGGRKKAATFSFRNTAAKTLQAYRAVLTE